MKVALITGSSLGIGAAPERSFAEKGYRVAINCLISEGAAFAVLEEINPRHRATLLLERRVVHALSFEQRANRSRFLERVLKIIFNHG